MDIGRDDTHQIMAYMYRLKAQRGGVVCPLTGCKNKVFSEQMHKDSYKGTMFIYALAIPTSCKSYSDFVKQMVNNEKAFLQVISQEENK